MCDLANKYWQWDKNDQNWTSKWEKWHTTCCNMILKNQFQWNYTKLITNIFFQIITTRDNRSAGSEKSILINDKMSYVNVKCTRGGNGWCLAIELYLKAWKLYSSSKKSFFAAPGYENEREESVAQTWSHHEERPIILSNGLTNSDQRNWWNTLVVKLITTCILIIHKLSNRWVFPFSF